MTKDIRQKEPRIKNQESRTKTKHTSHLTLDFRHLT